MISHPPASPLTLATGGTLARAPLHEVPRAGLFLTPPAFLPGAPCSVLLIRDARSARDTGVSLRAANRADCMRDRRGALPGRANGFPRRLLSILFHEAAHQFRAHDSNRNQAGPVLRHPVRKASAGPSPAQPRSPVPFQINHFTHRGGSICFQSDNGKHMRRAFHDVGKGFHGGHC